MREDTNLERGHLEVTRVMHDYSPSGAHEAIVDVDETEVGCRYPDV